MYARHRCALLMVLVCKHHQLTLLMVATLVLMVATYDPAQTQEGSLGSMTQHLSAASI